MSFENLFMAVLFSGFIGLMIQIGLFFRLLNNLNKKAFMFLIFMIITDFALFNIGISKDQSTLFQILVISLPVVAPIFLYDMLKES